MTARALVLAPAAFLLLVASAACSDTAEGDRGGYGDAKVGRLERGPADVITFPDKFGNIATKCDGHGHRVYSTTHPVDAASIAVIEDPSCPGGAAR